MTGPAASSTIIRPRSHSRSRRGALVITVALLLLGLAGPIGVVRGDLDVSSPPGTPDEWSRGLPTPVTTGRGRVPEITRRSSGTPGSGVGPHGHEQTVVAEPPPSSLEVPQLNSFNYFRVTTPDMPGHVVMQFPEHTIGPEGGGRVTVGPSSQLEAEYPPLFPPELVWDAMVTCLRMQMHPEVCSDTAALTHLIALGEPAVAGVELCGTKDVIELINRQIGTVPPSRPQPPVNKGRNVYEKMLINLATIELCNDWPGVMDPQYCRRTLSLGLDAVKPLIACTEVRHSALSRAATWALQAYSDAETLEQLRKLATQSQDMVVRVRALRALARAHDLDSAKVFKAMTADNNPILQVLGWQGVGAIGDMRAMPQLKRVLGDAIQMTNRGMLMALLPVVVRMRPDKDDKQLIRILQTGLDQFKEAFPAADAKPSYGVMRYGGQAIAPELIGFRNVIFHEMTLMALAVCGDERAAGEFIQRKLKSFHQVNWYLWCDACHALLPDPTALGLLEEAVADAPDPLVGVHALQLFARSGGRHTFIAEQARNGKDYVIRGQALLVLARLNPTMARTICKEVLSTMDVDSPKDAGAANQAAADQQRYNELMQMLRDPATRNDPNKMQALMVELGQLQMRMRGQAVPPAELSRSARAWFLCSVLSVGGLTGAWTFEDIAPVVRMGLTQSLTAHRQGSSNLREIPSVTTFPPLFETAVLELGRTADPRAVPLLLDVLRARLPGGSPEAAVGLGNFKYRSAAAGLIDALMSSDPWLRFCAWRALKTLSTEDWCVDWIDGGAGHFAASQKKYRDWMTRYFK
ncbi:MAG: HEAT repeat domain-containing protein [Planctomycetota bacterium]